MQIIAPPVDRNAPKPDAERRGDGKGKSTAAFGLALRAHGRAKAVATITTGQHFLVLLDKIMFPLRDGWLPLGPVLACLRQRPPQVQVVLTGVGRTGRNAPGELIELADTVTEMRLVKHHVKAGVPAQRGIED